MPTVCASDPVQAPTTTTLRPSFSSISWLIYLKLQLGVVTSGTMISAQSSVTSALP